MKGPTIHRSKFYYNIDNSFNNKNILISIIRYRHDDYLSKFPHIESYLFCIDQISFEFIAIYLFIGTRLDQRLNQKIGNKDQCQYKTGRIMITIVARELLGFLLCDDSQKFLLFTCTILYYISL